MTDLEALEHPGVPGEGAVSGPQTVREPRTEHGPDCCSHHPSCCGACDECLRICWGYHGPERRRDLDHVAEQAEADRQQAALAERERWTAGAYPTTSRDLFHGHHPMCGWTVEADPKACNCVVALAATPTASPTDHRPLDSETEP